MGLGPVSGTERQLLVPGSEEEEDEEEARETLQAEQPTSDITQFCMCSNWHRLSG